MTERNPAHLNTLVSPELRDSHSVTIIIEIIEPRVPGHLALGGIL